MQRRAFTIIDLLITVLVMALLVAIVVPSITHARGAGGQMGSMNNLRTLGAAHFVYSVDFNGRQLDFADDRLSTYGDYRDWFCNYSFQHGGNCSWGDPGNHPPMMLGWGRNHNGQVLEFNYNVVQAANAGLVIPINWDAPGAIGLEYFGSFRLPNVRQFNQYLGGRFYDEVFYAPTDTVVVDAVNGGFDSPDEWWPFADVSSGVGSIPAWSSYCLSPAGMYNSNVLRHDDPDDPDDGWTDPFTLADAFTTPSVAQVVYPGLKTHILEHHWLQNAPFDNCNPGFSPGTYGNGCEPYYFNHGLASVPFSLFYDGHVEGISVAQAMADDETVREMTGNENWGLWSKDTPWGEDGYLSEYGYDQAETSFHINTTDGVEGRDILAPGVTSSTERRRRPKSGVVRGPRPVRRQAVDARAPRVSYEER